MSLPASDFEIEVVLVITRSRWRFELRRAGFSGFFEFFFPDAGLVGDPVDLPGFAAVIGERLFEVSGVRGDLRPDESQQNHAAVDLFPIIKLALTVLEFTNGRYAKGAVFGVGPVDAPLMSGRIVETESHAFDVAGAAAGFELFDIGASVPEFSRDRGAVKFVPGRRSCEGLSRRLRWIFHMPISKSKSCWPSCLWALPGACAEAALA